MPSPFWAFTRPTWYREATTVWQPSASGGWGVLLSHPQTGHLPPLAVRPAKQFAHRLVSMFPSIGTAPSRAASLLILRGDSPWQAIISPILYHRPAPNTRKSAKHRKGRYEKPYRPGKFSLVFAKERQLRPCPQSRTAPSSP